jgi:hypothetical protein
MNDSLATVGSPIESGVPAQFVSDYPAILQGVKSGIAFDLHGCGRNQTTDKGGGLARAKHKQQWHWQHFTAARVRKCAQY